jgi:hypothetical protein
MKARPILFSLLTAWLCAGAWAQSWIVFSPRERDFRVVFPAPPVRAAGVDGAVEFKAGAGELQFVVVRRDPRRLADVSVLDDILKRLQARGDETIKRFGEEEGDTEPGEYIFRSGGVYTIHRVFADQRHYYELVVQSPPDDYATVRRTTARDFFGSFQVSGLGFPWMAARTTAAPDALCRDRPNVFARMYCEYRACIEPGNEKTSYCARLFGR